MDLEQDLINNYWNIPTPKSCSLNRCTSTADAFAFNTVIAQYNKEVLDDASLDLANEFDELIDKTMEQRGELCSILDVVRGRTSPIKKRKKTHLVPLTFLKFDTRSSGKGKPVTIKALLDSGGSGTIVSHKFATKLKRVRATPTRWSTPSGLMTTNEVVKIRMEFDEFIPGRKIHWKAHVAKDLGAYDMIIGRDLLSDLGIDISFSDQACLWENVSLPFKELDATVDAYHIHEPEVVQKATERVKEILDAEYEKANLPQVVEKCDHLTRSEKDQLLTLLLRYEDLFDGT